MIVVEVSLKGLDRKMGKLNKLEMSAVAIKALELNEKQISEKIDVKGRKFVPYSVAYAKKKGVSRENVTLVSNKKSRNTTGSGNSGHMMKEFGVLKAGKDKAIIGWTSPANKEKARGNYNTRKFVGLTAKSRKALVKYVEKEIL